MSAFLSVASLLIVTLPVSTAGEVEPDGMPSKVRCGPVVLSEISSQAGLKFSHRHGGRGEKHLVETMGAGLAWLDFDGDGWLDLYLVQSGPLPPDGSAAAADHLFRNLGDGYFRNTTERAGIAATGYGQGATAADIDGDGDVDVYVTNLGPDLLLLNDGRGGFADAAQVSGLGLDGWSSSAALADADGDADLDLYVTRYVIDDIEEELHCLDRNTGERRYCDPSMYVGADDVFYRNRGDGSFDEDKEALGSAPMDGRGLGLVFADLNGDLRPDLYVANDLNLNLLLANIGKGAFEDLSLVSGTAVNDSGHIEAGMGVTVADVDGDLDADLLVTNFDAETNTLYRNDGDFNFQDISAESGLGATSLNFLSFGVAVADYDRDGDPDIYVANGHIFERPYRKMARFRQRDQIYLGDGAGKFTELDCPHLGRGKTVARGAAVADFDNDGDPDVGVQENNGRFTLLRNDAEEGSWIGVRLRGSAPNTEAIGSRVVLATPRGKQIRWILAGDSYQSSSDRRALFGFAAETVDLEVTWPSGRRMRWERPPANRYLVVFEKR